MAKLNDRRRNRDGGTKLTPAEQAKFTARRKDAYEAKHPETRQHVAGGKAKAGAAGDNLSFAGDTAQRTGQNERTVQRDAARGDRIADDVLEDIQGTPLDKGVVLDEIAATPRAEQPSKVQELRSDGPAPSRSFIIKIYSSQAD